MHPADGARQVLAEVNYSRRVDQRLVDADAPLSDRGGQLPCVGPLRCVLAAGYVPMNERAHAAPPPFKLEAAEGTL